MINYVNKGIELIEEIEKQGYVLYNLDGVWVTNGNDEAVQSIIDNFVIPEPDPVANWDMFNVSMMSNQRFNEVYVNCSSVAPLVGAALPTALDQVTSKGTTLFNLVFNQICQIGGATVEDRLVWGVIAQDNNLPQDFIDILIG